VIMLTKVTSTLARKSHSAYRCAAVYMSSDHGHHKSLVDIAHEQRTHINDLPIPAGSWEEYNGKRNARWNMQLGAGIVAFAITVFSMKQLGVLYFHEAPDFKKLKINVK
jgi:hypothetical protein